MLEKRDACPACNSLDGATLLETSYSDPGLFGFLRAYYYQANPESIRHRLRGGSLTILECKVCGLVYQRDVPDSDFMRELYEEWVIEGDDLAPTSKPMSTEHYAYVGGEVMHLLSEQRSIVGPERRVRVLDFGMGWAAWLQMARSLGATVYGAELSEPKVAYARSIGIPVLTLAEISTMEFDLICAEQVFEHLPYPAPVLKALLQSLAPEGYFKISVPSGRSIKKVLAGWTWSDAMKRQDELMPIYPLEHINCFTSQSLDALAGRYGLERAPLSPLRAIALSFDWRSRRSALRNLLRPIYRFGLKRGTYAIYRRRTPVS